MFYRTIIKYFLAITCFIFLYSCNNTTSTVGGKQSIDSIPKEVTYNKDVAKIIYQKCATCHRPGESGPFALLTFTDVYRRKKTIVKVTHSGYMPPWPADRTYSSFVGELYLTDYEKKILKTWVEQGAKEGDDIDKPIAPKFPVGSQLGKPDLVIKLPKPYQIQGNNHDHYVIMKIPYEIPKDQYVRTIEFVPGNRKRVHHVNGYMVVYEDGKKKNVRDGEFFVNNYEMEERNVWKKLKIMNDDGSFPLRIPSATNYLPGVVAPVYPPGIGGFLMKKKGAILLNDIHYGPSPKNEVDESYFNVFFSKIQPERKFGEFQLGTYGVSKIEPALMIPPDSIKTFTSQYTVQSDISIVTINPHMHLLGKSFIAYIVDPEGKTTPLIKINHWDFRWQYFYTFKKMVKVPRGSTIYLKATFDNTKNNPFNPFSPPQWVGERSGSMSTKDEMLQFIITYLDYKPGDENISLESELK